MRKIGIPVLVYEPCRAEPIVAADSGIPPGCLAHAVGPERLHSAFGGIARAAIDTTPTAVYCLLIANEQEARQWSG